MNTQFISFLFSSVVVDARRLPRSCKSFPPPSRLGLPGVLAGREDPPSPRESPLYYCTLSPQLPPRQASHFCLPQFASLLQHRESTGATFGALPLLPRSVRSSKSPLNSCHLLQLKVCTVVYTIINTRVISGKILAASSSKRGSEIVHFAQVE